LLGRLGEFAERQLWNVPLSVPVTQA
jgi:hypothetical protein